MIRRRVTAIAAAAALAAAALALLPAASGAADSVVRIGLPQQPNTLNPLVGGEFYENYLDEAIFSGLVVIDSRGNVAPDLIQNVPTKRNGGISGDGLTITYILQPGLKWQDGAPLTAADVAFTFKLMRDPKVPFPLASQYTNVASLEARDKQTVVVHLKKPDADAVAELFVNGQNGSIVPEHVLRNAADIRKAPFSAKPVGSGPYSVESWSRDTGLVLRANPRYFRGRPAIGELRVRVIPDTNTMAIALRAGDLDFAPGITPAAVSMLRGTPAIRLDEAPTEGLVWLIDRVDAPPFDDARVRRAFGLDAGRDAIARKAYLGYAQPAVELEREHQVCQPMLERVGCRPPNPALRAGSLSGGAWVRTASARAAAESSRSHSRRSREGGRCSPQRRFCRRSGTNSAPTWPSRRPKRTSCTHLTASSPKVSFNSR